MKDWMRVGIIHGMAFPETLSGSGPILETAEAILRDPFFELIEVSWVKDPETRKRLIQLIRQVGASVSYCAGPPLLTEKINLSDTDEDRRKQAVERCKSIIDEAYEFGAIACGFLTGPDPGESARAAAVGSLTRSLVELCRYAESRAKDYVMVVSLENFDRTVDKKLLVGPTRESVEVARAVRQTCPNMGLTLCLSHLPLLGEGFADAVAAAAPYLAHVHIGNSVVKDPAHPGFGDKHPRFGIDGGEIGVRELSEFLAALVRVGYLDPKKPRRATVSFEVRPLPGERSADVIANAKATLKEAWASVERTSM